MSDQDATLYEQERTLTFISTPIYRVHTLRPMLFCADTGAPISSIGNQALKRIVHSAGRNSIPIIESNRDFQFGNTMMKYKGMGKLILPIPGSAGDIPIMMDVVDVDILALLGLDVLNGKNLLVDNVTGNFAIE